MNHIDLANHVLIDIKNHQRQDAAIKISTLLNENANLVENWGAITRLALSIGEIHSAVASAHNYLSLGPKEPKRIMQVAGILAEAGRVEQAIELVESNCKVIPSITRSHFLGTAYSQVGLFDKALANLEVVLKANPLIGISWLTFAAIIKFKNNDNKLLQLRKIEQKFKDGNDDQNDIPYWFAFGKALLDIGEEEQAFKKFAIGNKLMNQKDSFNRAAYSQYIDSIINVQNAQYFETITPLVTSDKSPIFIIGLPRSGTTLLQQVLSAHSQISNGGEANCFTLASSDIQHFDITTKSSSDVKASLEKASDEYYHLMAEKYGASNYYVDKTLNLNHQIGFIKLCFPNAKIIKIHRDAKDTAWSCYRTFFNQGLPWTCCTDDISLFFKQENRLFEHWKSIFKEGIFELTYEQLVSDSQDTLKRLMEFLSLDFESSMLEFYKNKSIVQTASVGQVRSTFNTNSIGSSRNLPSIFDDF